jgi:phage terminase large subunit-like protein
MRGRATLADEKAPADLPPGRFVADSPLEGSGSVWVEIGTKSRCLVATTPRPTKLIRELLAREGRDVVVTRGSTYENRANLATGYFEQVIRKYEGTRLGRQELNAELLDGCAGWG